MRSHIILGRVFGIEVGLHLSWLIIALLITFSLAAHFQAVNPDWAGGVAWFSAFITAILFFAGLLAHELSHALMARSKGLPTRRITLFALGGVAQIEKEAESASTEFLVAIVGPITSIVLGGLFLLAASAMGWQFGADAETPVIAVLVWLGYINIILALFNLIPGFPLDGGRVLRAILWWKTGEVTSATRMAARVGQLVALAFIFWGIFRFFGGAGIGGLWLAFIGWFLMEAAGASYAQVEAANTLRGLKVRDLMTRDCAMVERGMSLQSFVDEMLLRTGRRCFLVQDNGYLAGLITPHEVRQVERERWPFTPVGEVMRRLNELRVVDPETPVTEALELMMRNDINQIPVVANGELEGMLSRGQVLQLLQARADLKM